MKVNFNTGGMLSIALSSVLLSSCSDPKAANETNFLKALAPSVANAFCRPLTTPLRLTEADADRVNAFPLALTSTAWANDQVRNLLESSAKEGLLTRKEQTLPATGRIFGDHLKPTKVITFEPSEKGKAIFRDIPDASGRAPQATACFGTGKIDKIVRWTEPAELLGNRVTHVTYTFSATDVPSALPADLREGLATPKEATATLVQGNDGWQIAR